MAQVEFAVIQDHVALIRMNRPERLNAMGVQLLTELAEAWSRFQQEDDLHVAILTGTGRGFCVGEDLKEAAERGRPGLGDVVVHDPYWHRELEKPTIAAVNGWAIGGGVALTSFATLRVASREAIFEWPQIRHWGVGKYGAGLMENLPIALGAELALGFRITGQRAYEMGWVNRVAEPGEEVEVALQLAEHLAAIRPAAARNTLALLRRLEPAIPADVFRDGQHLRLHGVDEDLMESRRAFVERSESR